MKHVATALAFAGAALAVAGCAQKFTRVRYDTVWIGMPKAEVLKTLGQPNARIENEWSYVNQFPFYRASIFFRDGRVSDKAWFDEKPSLSVPSDKQAIQRAQHLEQAGPEVPAQTPAPGQ